MIVLCIDIRRRKHEVIGAKVHIYRSLLWDLILELRKIAGEDCPLLLLLTLCEKESRSAFAFLLYPYS